MVDPAEEGEVNVKSIFTQIPVHISTYGVVALEGLERAETVHGRGIADPLQRLVVGDDPDVLHGVDGVQELDEALLVVRLREPGGVVVQSEGRTVGRVMAVKVLHDHLGDSVRLRGVRTGVSHGAPASVQVLPHHHGHLPDARVALGGTRRDHAVVEDLVVQGVRPARGLVLVHGHGRVVGEVGVVQALEHLVAADREEGRAHATHILLLHTTVRGQDLTLSGHLPGPLLLRELLSEAVTVGKEKGGN